MGAGGGQLVGAWLHCRRSRRHEPASDRNAGDEALQGPLDPVSWRRICALYCAAHFGKSLLWTASDLLTLYLLVSVYGLSPMTAGLVFLIWLAANALADFGDGLWEGRSIRAVSS